MAMLRKSGIANRQNLIAPCLFVSSWLSTSVNISSSTSSTYTITSTASTNKLIICWMIYVNFWTSTGRDCDFFVFCSIWRLE